MTDSPPQHGDWNDLAQLVGRESARRQLLDAYAAAAPANETPDESPAPSNEPAALTAPDLDHALQRFAWTVPDGKIWDAAPSRIMSHQV